MYLTHPLRRRILSFNPSVHIRPKHLHYRNTSTSSTFRPDDTRTSTSTEEAQPEKRETHHPTTETTRKRMRLPYVTDPPPAATPEEQAIIDAVRARRAPRPLQPLDLTLLVSFSLFFLDLGVCFPQLGQPGWGLGLVEGDV